ncbi:MAG: hypothetical protein K2L82_01010 [Lachnospiraceae bacterium]|nr:hypothetical protein [Lachnospiraceae bacterium]
MNVQLKEDKRAQMRRKMIQILVLTAMGIMFYLVLGQEWIAIEDDTPFYLNPRREGVMPVYPLFLFVVKCIFGEKIYLDAVVVIQSVLAIVCTMAFVLYLQKHFRLHWIETVLLYIACMLPFSIYLPEAGITHQILTEGLSYAIFYLYFMLLLQYVFEQKIRWLIAATAMAGFMELIRSQMLFLLGVTAAVFVCVEFVKSRKDKVSRRIIKVGANCVIGVIGILVVVTLVYKIFGWYWVHQLPVIEKRNQQTVAADAGASAEGAAQSVQGEESAVQQDASGTSPVQETVQEEKSDAPVNEDNPGTLSQFTSLIITRGIYEIDEDDIELFDSPEMKEIFQRVFDAIDAEQYRYVYARQDLYMWRDLVKDEIPIIVFGHVGAYLRDNPEVQMNNVQICRELGMKVLLHHFDRYLYHSFRMMVSGFISSVFFQIERIYFLCHIITLLLYLAAATGIIYCLKKGGNKKVAAFAGTTLGYIFLMVVVTNLVFLGLQRYMVYAMGIFYCSMYLLAREAALITAEDLPWIKKIKR